MRIHVWESESLSDMLESTVPIQTFNVAVHKVLWSSSEGSKSNVTYGNERATEPPFFVNSVCLTGTCGSTRVNHFSSLLKGTAILRFRWGSCNSDTQGFYEGKANVPASLCMGWGWALSWPKVLASLFTKLRPGTGRGIETCFHIGPSPCTPVRTMIPQLYKCSANPCPMGPSFECLIIYLISLYAFNCIYHLWILGCAR